MTFRAIFPTFALFFALGGLSLTALGQTNPPPPKPMPTPAPRQTPDPVLTAKIPDPPKQIGEIPRERRAQAYAKLLEGQRYFLILERTRPQSPTYLTNLKLARQTLQKAVELDPQLAEGYTALAELNLRITPVQLEDTIRLATIAKSLNPDNFGARQWLARVYTLKSGVYDGTLENESAAKAINEWKEVTRLDPRNAEAWAFLSDLYQKNKQQKEEIEALQKWMGAVAPTDLRFYSSVTGKRELSSTEASARLGEAYIRDGRNSEAISVLGEAIADDPENTQYIELFRQAIAGGNEADSAKAVETLQQAVFASPNNLVLIELLAKTQIRAGQIDSAAKNLRTASERAQEAQENGTATQLLILLGDLYAEAFRENDALTAYDQALKVLGIDKTPVATDDEREVVSRVFPKIISVNRNAGRYNEAKLAIDRMKILLGTTDTTADQELIQLLREKGDKTGALRTVRLLRQKNPDDLQLLQIEASILADLGRVDEGVALWKTKIINKDSKVTTPIAADNDFRAYLFISTLYGQAKRGTDAVNAAKKALEIANQMQVEQWQKIANLNLATAQHTAKDFAGSEATLRGILKTTPNDATALNNLGYFLLERNERAPEALGLILKAVKIEPTNSSFLDSLGWAYFKMNKFDEAEKYLLEASRRDPTSATIHDHLGDVYQKQGKIELARTTWQKALTLTNDADEIAKIKTKIGEAANKSRNN